MKYLKEYKIFEYLANEKLVKSTINESIMENGLEIRNNENYWDTPELNNPGAIFASSDKDFWINHFYENDTISIYKIDTSKIKNNWFADYNLIN